MVAAAGFLLTMLSLALPAQAAGTAEISLGDRIRVWTGERIVVTGTTRIDISRSGASRVKRARRAAVCGALVGGALGALSLGLQHDQVGASESSVGKAAALGAYSGGLFGGLAGAVIGAARGGERWERVYP